MEIIISDKVLSEQRVESLRRFFKLSTVGKDDDKLRASVTSLVNAATEEYLAMILDGGFPSTITEAKEKRLLCLINHCFSDNNLDEFEIGRYLRITATQAKTLRKNVQAKHANQLFNHIRRQIKNILDEAKKSGKDWILTTKSTVVIDTLNDIIATEFTGYERAKQSSPDKYTISDTCYLELKKLSYFE